MQSDEVVWQLIMHGHCSFRAKTTTQNFCRNEYNVTGLCNRSSCPLANSRYATIREEAGRVYLLVKTVERAHSPKALWQKIRLRRSYAAALAQVDEHLAHWPKFLVHKNKQRLTKVTQYLIRVRKLATKPRPALATVPARKEKLEARREAKAETAAQLEASIERELLARLRAGTYGDIYNFPQRAYEAALAAEAGEAAEAEADAEAAAIADEVEYVEGDSEDEDDDEGWDDDDDDEEEEQVEWVEGDYESGEDDDDVEDLSAGGSGDDGGGAGTSSGDDGERGGTPARPAAGKRGAPAAAAAAAPAAAAAKRRRGAPRPRLELEYEEEREPAARGRR